MATVRVSYTWSTGETLAVTTVGKTSYPDALSHLRAEAVRGFREGLGVIGGTPAEVGAIEPEVEG